MDRRTLAGGLGGLALVVAAVVVLRQGDAPDNLKREIDDDVQVVQQQEPVKPGSPRAQALDVDTLQVAWAGSAPAYEVRWNGNEQLVPNPEVELAGLSPDNEVQVEIRAVNAIGRRSEPLKISAVPKNLYNDRWDDLLVGQTDRFDGPESLDPRKWRVEADQDCLGLRPFGPSKRIDVDCSTAMFQSNTPIRFGVPAPDGAIGRAIISVAGAVESSHVRLTLLPDPWQFLKDQDVQPNGAVSLDITTQGTRIVADPDLPRSDKQIELGDSPLTGLVAGVRHRWEMRVLPDAVVALRDGVVVAAEPVVLRARLMHPRIRIDGGGFLDTFGVGGVPERAVPTEVIALARGRSSCREDAIAAKLVTIEPGNLVKVTDVPVNSRIRSDPSRPGRALPQAGKPPWSTPPADRPARRHQDGGADAARHARGRHQAAGTAAERWPHPRHRRDQRHRPPRHRARAERQTHRRAAHQRAGQRGARQARVLARRARTSKPVRALGSS